MLAEFGQHIGPGYTNPFTGKAYIQAARSVATSAIPIGDLIDQNRLHELPGVGTAIAEIIVILHQTGTHPDLERVRRARLKYERRN